MINPITTAETLGAGFSAMFDDDNDKVKAAAQKCAKMGICLLAAKMCGMFSDIFDGDISGTCLKVAGFDIKENVDVIAAGTMLGLATGLAIKSVVRKG